MGCLRQAYDNLINLVSVNNGGNVVNVAEDRNVHHFLLGGGTVNEAHHFVTQSR